MKTLMLCLVLLNLQTLGWFAIVALLGLAAWAYFEKHEDERKGDGNVRRAK